MTNQELLDELRAEIAKLREEIAEVKAQGTRIVFVPQMVPQPYPVYPLYPQPYVVPWYPSPLVPTPTYPQITW